MKYIRTKDGIEQYNEKDAAWYIENGFLFGYGFAFKIIKQADTIEELCDFLVGWRGKDFMLYCSFELGLINKKEVDTIYGAIWTDKGLIYVAKMNDKGELELL